LARNKGPSLLGIKYVELEYTLMDEAEEKSMIEAHIHGLPAIHEETRLAFDAFANFLNNSHKKQP
jgi:hypothetical protein